MDLFSEAEKSYNITVVSRDSFETVLANVSMGLRFWTVDGVVHVSEYSGQMFSPIAVNECTVCEMVQVFIAANLENIRILQRSNRAWCFSIVIVPVTKL